MTYAPSFRNVSAYQRSQRSRARPKTVSTPIFKPSFRQQGHPQLHFPGAQDRNPARPVRDKPRKSHSRGSDLGFGARTWGSHACSNSILTSADSSPPCTPRPSIPAGFQVKLPSVACRRRVWVQLLGPCKSGPPTQGGTTNIVPRLPSQPPTPPTLLDRGPISTPFEDDTMLTAMHGRPAGKSQLKQLTHRTESKLQPSCIHMNRPGLSVDMDECDRLADTIAAAEPYIRSSPPRWPKNIFFPFASQPVPTFGATPGHAPGHVLYCCLTSK